MVSDVIVEEVRARADLVELCGEHTSLKRSGKTYRGPCPLHGGEGPNFSVDPSRGIFKCFVCDEGGDVFAFVMKRLGMDFPSAVRHLAGRYGIPIPEERQGDDPHGRLREATAFAEEWFASNLRGPDGGTARAYLEGRGLDGEATERFTLGWAPGGWRALREAARAVGLDDAVLLEAGLVATSEKAEEPYDRFRDRLIFSIRDLRDRPIGFGGRVLGDAPPETPKYLNSPDSPIFHKSRVLYGLVWARHAIRREGTALLVEGYMDVLALHQHGFPTAVAPLGTALARAQAELLGRYGKRAVLLYDSDRAGRRAAFRNGDVLLAAGLEPLIATLPPGEDPDSLVRGSEGERRLGAYVEGALDLLEAKLVELERRGWLETIEGRRRAVDRILDTLRAAADPTLRDLYFSRAAERLGVRRETLVREAARGGPSARRVPGPSTVRSGEGTQRRRSDGAAEAERLTLLLLLRDPGLLGAASAAGLRAEHFEDPVRRSVFEGLREGRFGGEVGFGDAPPEQLALLAELRADDTELTHPEEIFAHAARRLLQRRLKARLAEIDRAIEYAEESHARELLREKETLARELREAGASLSFLRRAGGSPAGERERAPTA